LSLNQYGKAGWELVSLLETMDGLIAVFKQPLDADIRTVLPRESPAERMSRLPKVEEKRTQALVGTFDQRLDDAGRNEDIAEAMLLDESEIAEARVERAGSKRTISKPSVTPVDVGSIRIE
jgi:hypothetical protein